jgi:hypothetical protein
LKIRWDTNWKWGCLTSEFTETFWTGGEEHRTDTSTGEPETVDCAIGRSVDPNYSPGSDTAIRWLEKALTLNQGSPELTSEELTLVYYHLAVLYLKQGDAPNSHRYLGLIEDLAGADIEIAANLWAEIQPLLLVGELKYYSLCEAAHRLALPLSDVSPHGDVYVYEYKGTDAGYKVPLCDPFGVQLETLNGLIFEQDEDSLRSAILDAGLPLVEIIQVSLPGNQIGWTVVLDEFAFVSPFGFSDGTGKSLYGFFGGRGWAWINTFGGPIDFQSISQDWNNDGLPEIGFAAGKFGWEYGCEDQNTGYEVVWIADVKQSITVTSHGIYCFPDNLPFDWDFIALDKDGDAFSDWALDQLYWTSGSIDTIQSEFQVAAWKVTISESREIIEVGSVSTGLSDLDRRFFDSTNRAVFRSELLDLINQWSVEISPLGDHVNAHLRYLLALTYEAEGDEIHAVETFYALWADHPDTLWGQLAAARLELKP